MGRALRLATLGVPVGGGGVTYESYITATLNPLLWFRFQEAAGNAVNSGSEGGVASVANTTQEQTGQLGASEAYKFNGTTSLVSMLNAALPNLKALTTQRWMFLLNAATLGESDSGRFFCWGDSGGHNLSFFSANRVTGSFVAATTNAAFLSETNAVDFLGKWTLVFLDFDDANALGNGRKVRIFRATADSAVTALTLSTNNAAVGALTSQTDALFIGNRNPAATAGCMNGLIDEVVAVAGLWTPADAPTDFSVMQTIADLVF
jgi:hypothetical protein